MAWQNTDFLQKEVNESKTSNSSRNETLKILHEARILLEKQWKTKDAKEGYDQIRLSIISALKDSENRTKGKLSDLRGLLDWWEETESLSDWEITQEELKHIKSVLKKLEDNWKSKWDKFKSLLWEALKSIESENTKDVLKIFKKYKNKIRNKNVREYVEEEEKRLKDWWEKTEWTYLLYSIVSRIPDSKLDKSFMRHNIKQDAIIKGILWTEKWHNNEYIKWYNSDLSNYLVKIEDFENDLRSPNKKILWDKNNPNIINSLALANYLSYIFDKNLWNTYKSFKEIKTKLWEDKLNSLAEVWNSNSNTIAQGVLKNNWYWEVLGIIKNPEEIISTEDIGVISTAIEIWWEEFVEQLANIIKNNVKNPDFEKKLRNFYEKIYSCPKEIRDMIEKTIGNIEDIITENWEIQKEKIKTLQEETIKDQKEKSKQTKKVEEFLKDSLGINEEGLENSELQEKIPLKDRVREKIESLNDKEKIKAILDKLNEYKLSYCIGVFWIWLKEIYKKLNNKYIELEKISMWKNLEKLINSKWIEDTNKIGDIKEEIIEEIKSSNCTTDIIKKVSDIFKKNGLEISFKDKDIISNIINSNLELQRAEIRWKLHSKLEDTSIKEFEEKSREEQQKILKDAWYDEEKTDDILEKTKKINNALKNNEIIRNTNKKEFSFLLEKIEEATNLEELQGVMDEVSEMYEIRVWTPKENYTIISVVKEESWNFTIVTNSWEEVTWITPEEKKSIENSPEALNNLLNFKKTLDDLNIGFIWDIRGKYLEAMNMENSTISVSNDEDTISKEELRKILNFTLKVVWEKHKNEDIDSTIAKIRDLNWAGLDDESSNVVWRSKIEQMFWDKWYITPEYWLNVAKIQDEKNWGRSPRIESKI